MPMGTAKHALALEQRDCGDAFAATCDESQHPVQTDAVAPTTNLRQGSSIRPNHAGPEGINFEKSFPGILRSARLSSPVSSNQTGRA